MFTGPSVREVDLLLSAQPPDYGAYEGRMPSGGNAKLPSPAVHQGRLHIP